ncbi:MAG TPA: hypothetical protein VGE09_06265 [Pseudoxanthomonas sp.]
MTMEFLPLTNVSYGGVGTARRTRRASALGFVIAADSGIATARRRRISFGLLEGGGEIEVPAIPAVGNAQRFRHSTGILASHDAGTVESVRFRRSAAQEGSVARAQRQRFSRGYAELDLSAYGFLVDQPPVMSAFGDQWFQILSDGLAFAGRPVRLPTAVLREIVAIQAGRRALYEGTQRIEDVAAFGSRITWVVQLLVQEGVAVGGVATADFTQLIRVVARLLASGQAAHFAEALVQVIDGIVLLAASQSLNKAEVSDTVALRALVDALYAAVAHALDRVLLQATASGTQQFVAVVTERVAMLATASGQVDLVMLLRESIGFAATLSIDNGEYIAWVLNTESKGLSRYTNYPFNSFAKIGGRYFGAASDGVHRLDGEDDNGDDIHAFIRSGLEAFGTRRLKRIPEAFVGYSSDGTLILKAIIVDEDGNKSAAIYRLPTRGAANKRANRFKLGRGLESVDWAFELHNADGADFDLGSIEFRPANLTRRTRG